jgi:transposase
MNQRKWNECTHFAALDWASDHHDVVVINAAGQIEQSLRFAHSAEGWAQFAALAHGYPDMPIAVETSHGTLVDRLFEFGLQVYPINPRCAARYRERHAPDGLKDDQRDAWSLADALRMDGAQWRALAPLDPLIAELRLLCRDEIGLIEQRTAMVNQLKQALRDYYPAAVEAFEDWTRPMAWSFIEAFPTPALLAKAGRGKWTKFLHTHKLWREGTAESRLALFARAEAFTGSAPMIAAKSLLALSLVRTLRTLEQQLRLYRERIEALFVQHPDHDLFGSLPGTGGKLAPRLLAEMGDDRARFTDPESLQCYAGTAPITVQSGKMCYQQVRRGCAKSLRAAVHLWVDHSRSQCAWAQVYYQSHRDRGQNHACALRCLGQRWMKILWKMWQTHTAYDEALHTRNQIAHGSWTLSPPSPRSA